VGAAGASQADSPLISHLDPFKATIGQIIRDDLDAAKHSWKATSTRFRVLGGVPRGKVRYDALRAAGFRVGFARPKPWRR
jgi:hypothetical protein